MRRCDFRGFDQCCWLLVALGVVLRLQAEESKVAADLEGRSALSNLIDQAPERTQLGVVAWDSSGKEIFAYQADRELPTASSIKPLLLLELFSCYAGELDVTERSDIKAILKDQQHPAVSHFNRRQCEMIAEDLARCSIRRLGKIMIDSTDESGKEYANVVYNGAANVAIALLGGPAKATDLIHKRSTRFRNVHVRRYMLADRNEAGDNTASPNALAGLFRALFCATEVEIPDGIPSAMAPILHRPVEDQGMKLYAKGGTLHSDPVTCVQTGHCIEGERHLSYAVMASQPRIRTMKPQAQYDHLDQLSREIVKELRQHGKD